MSLIDKTNESITLALHAPMRAEEGIYWPELRVDVDADSSFSPPVWVVISFTDDSHDADHIKLTLGEAGLLADRLGLILVRTGTAMKSGGEA